MKMIDTAAAAAKLGVNEQRVRALLAQRRIPGSRRIGRQWFVPEDFLVLPGTRGPVSPKSRVLRRIGRVMDQTYKVQRMAELVEKMRRNDLSPAERSELKRIDTQFARRIAPRSLERGTTIREKIHG